MSANAPDPTNLPARSPIEGEAGASTGQRGGTRSSLVRQRAEEAVRQIVSAIDGRVAAAAIRSRARHAMDGP
jgi:hypothetical protein